jgi:anthranilate phosphoribosyltransferase
MPVRLALGFPTIFNVLGPLTNPAGARRQLMGVYDACYLEPVAEALATLGTLRAMVVHSDDGLDEISIGAPTTIMEVAGDTVQRHTIDPGQLGLASASFEALAAANLDHAAAMVRRVVGGDELGPARDMTLINAAATLLVGDAVGALEEGLSRAATAIDSGAAKQTLARLIEISNQ